MDGEERKREYICVIEIRREIAKIVRNEREKNKEERKRKEEECVCACACERFMEKNY